jgi:hypothetical protein
MSPTLHPSEDRLIDLAAQLLAPQLESETLRHLEACAACETRFRSICRDAELAQLRAPASRRAPRWRLPAVAAAVILAVLSITAWTRRAERTDPSAYWFPVPIETVALRTGAPAGDQAVFHDAVEAYRRHDPARVVALLRDRSIPESLDPLKIMLASAFVKTGDPARAEALLSQLRIETIPQPDRDRASWILYAALVESGKLSEAKALGESLATRPGEFAEAARRAVDRLRQSGQ